MAHLRSLRSAKSRMILTRTRLKDRETRRMALHRQFMRNPDIAYGGKIRSLRDIIHLPRSLLENVLWTNSWHSVVMRNWRVWHADSRIPALRIHLAMAISPSTIFLTQ